MERESGRLTALARSLGDTDASRPVVDGWSVRDVIAHCIYWQASLARLMGADLPAPPWSPRTVGEADLGRDELNRRTVQHYATYPVEGVLADFQFTADLVRRIVSEMKEQNLALEAGDPWVTGTPVWEAIASESHLHWEQHADELDAALASGPEHRS